MAKTKASQLKEISHTNGKISIPTDELKFKPVSAKSLNQKSYIKAIKSQDIVFAIGYSGSGKTTIAVAMAIESVLSGQTSKIIVTRPVVEAGGEHIGFLPGSFSEKLDPYIRPIYDEVDNYLEGDEAKKFKSEKIEICPLGYTRGRTFKDRFIIADEMQNATFDQLEMLLTRIGEGSKMVITGDPHQSDLDRHLQGGLVDMADRLKGIEGVQVVYLEKIDIVRHPIVTRIIQRLEETNPTNRVELPPRRLEDILSLGDGTINIDRDFEDEVY
jgi:phosphate starvation-inducible PhoH-like protein